MLFIKKQVFYIFFLNTGSAKNLLFHKHIQFDQADHRNQANHVDRQE